jgi:hypothetical protein
MSPHLDAQARGSHISFAGCPPGRFAKDDAFWKEETLVGGELDTYLCTTAREAPAHAARLCRTAATRQDLSSLILKGWGAEQWTSS